MQAADALFVKLADYCIAHADKAAVFGGAVRAAVDARARDNHRLLAAVLRGYAVADLRARAAAPALRPDQRTVRQRGLAATSLPRSPALKTEDAWLDRAGATLAAGSPSTAALTIELQRRAQHLSLADVFRMEFVAALHCARRPDLAEGIRALLIDKDQRPRWQPPTLARVTPEWIEGYFASPWKAGEHPLADLGA